LHSIIPAPVASRNFLTKSAEIAISQKLPVVFSSQSETQLVATTPVETQPFKHTKDSGRRHAPARSVRFEFGVDAGKSKKNS
jgi:hypothetical protein